MLRFVCDSIVQMNIHRISFGCCCSSRSLFICWLQIAILKWPVTFFCVFFSYLFHVAVFGIQYNYVVCVCACSQAKRWRKKNWMALKMRQRWKDAKKMKNKTAIQRAKKKLLWCSQRAKNWLAKNDKILWRVDFTSHTTTETVRLQLK